MVTLRYVEPRRILSPLLSCADVPGAILFPFITIGLVWLIPVMAMPAGETSSLACSLLIHLSGAIFTVARLSELSLPSVYVPGPKGKETPVDSTTRLTSDRPPMCVCRGCGPIGLSTWPNGAVVPHLGHRNDLDARTSIEAARTVNPELHPGHLTFAFIPRALFDVNHHHVIWKFSVHLRVLSPVGVGYHSGVDIVEEFSGSHFPVPVLVRSSLKSPDEVVEKI